MSWNDVVWSETPDIFDISVNKTALRIYQVESSNDSMYLRYACHVKGLFYDVYDADVSTP